MGITHQQTLDCFASDDLIGIGMEADAVRRQLHPEGVVSYAVEADVDSMTGFEELCAQIDRLVAAEGTGVRLRANSTPVHGVEWYEALLRSLGQRFPRVSPLGLTASDIAAVAGGSSLSVRDTLVRLRDAGLASLAGDDAGIFSMASSTASLSASCSAEQWIEIHRAAHAVGLPTMAAMRFGAGETVEERVAHLQTLRELQEETRGFSAFALLSYQPNGAASGFDEPTAVEYLQALAICRMYLDNFAHIQGDGAAQGTKVLGMSLRFGADDAGSILMTPSGMSRRAASEEEVRRVVRDAGLKPVQRDSVFNTMFLG